MIQVSSPLKRDFIIELIDGYEQDGYVFKFEKQDGIKVLFSANTVDDKAVSIVKTRIKDSELGKALFFQVVAI